MKILFIVLVVYMVISIGSLLLGLAINGKFDQSSQPVEAMAKDAFSWPWILLKFIAR